MIYILFASFLISFSYNIIRDLPYNIYYIEDMDKYENKFIPEGNKFFIRLPYCLDKEIKFYLTIPKNITLFPIYSSEFSAFPKDEELINTDFKNEIDLINIEDLNYSTYSFSIKKKELYQVLYFQNNEILDYISFYVHSNSSNENNITITNLTINYGLYIYSLYNESSYYFKTNTKNLDKKVLEIETRTHRSNTPNFQIDIKCFSYEPTDDEVTLVDNSWRKDLSYESEYYFPEERNYEYEPDEEFLFCAIHMYNKNALDELYIRVSIKYKLPGWAIALMVIVGFFVMLGVCFCLRSKGARGFLATLCFCALCVATMANNA